jgi:lysozyme
MGEERQMTRDEAHAGQFLKVYERMRYSDADRVTVQPIIIQPDAEQFADVSFWQAGMDWDEYAKHARAVFLRIGQNTWKDVEFIHNYNEARRVGLVIGGYFFFDGRATPQQQAEVIIEQMQGRYFEMELLIDWEHNYGGHYEGLPNVVKLMQLVEAAGVRCKAVGTYTGFYFWIENSNASANGAQYTYVKQRPLWIAWYASASIVRVPAPWTDWTHWQFGTPAVSWGQPSAEIDMNKHNGTRAQFEQRYIGEVSQPPTGEPMSTYTVTAPTLSNVALRPDHHTNNTAILYVPKGTALQSDLIFTAVTELRNAAGTVYQMDGDQWAYVTYNGQFGWVAIIHRGMRICTLVTNPVEPPPATGLPEVLFIGTTREDVREYRKAA